MNRPPRPEGLVFALTVVLGLAVSCELAVNVDALDNGRCRTSDQKRCGDRCVPRSDPTTGCALLSCAPCVLSHATATCGNNGECVISVCIGNYRDCDIGQPGCETDIAHDPNHCGGCTAAPCVTANGFPGCSASVCATGGCKPGFEDCNTDPLDGCETDLRSDGKHCGRCRQPCSTGALCHLGVCG